MATKTSFSQPVRVLRLAISLGLALGKTFTEFKAGLFVLQLAAPFQESFTSFRVLFASLPVDIGHGDWTAGIYFRLAFTQAFAHHQIPSSTKIARLLGNLRRAPAARYQTG